MAAFKQSWIRTDTEKYIVPLQGWSIATGAAGILALYTMPNPYTLFLLAITCGLFAWVSEYSKYRIFGVISHDELEAAGIKINYGQETTAPGHEPAEF